MKQVGIELATICVQCLGQRSLHTKLLQVSPPLTAGCKWYHSSVDALSSLIIYTPSIHMHTLPPLLSSPLPSHRSTSASLWRRGAMKMTPLRATSSWVSYSMSCYSLPTLLAALKMLSSGKMVSRIYDVIVMSMY